MAVRSSESTTTMRLNDVIGQSEIIGKIDFDRVGKGGACDGKSERGTEHTGQQRQLAHDEIQLLVHARRSLMKSTNF